MMGFLDHDHCKRGELCGEVERKGGRKDEGWGRKNVDCMRWMEARGRLQEEGNLLGGTWGRLLKESSKIKINKNKKGKEGGKKVG